LKSIKNKNCRHTETLTTDLSEVRYESK